MQCVYVYVTGVGDISVHRLLGRVLASAISWAMCACQQVKQHSVIAY